MAYSHPGTPEAHDARDARWRQLVERLSQVELSAEQADRGGRRRRRRFRFVSRSGQGSAWSVWSGLVRSGEVWSWNMSEEVCEVWGLGLKGDLGIVLLELRVEIVKTSPDQTGKGALHAGLGSSSNSPRKTGMTSLQFDDHPVA